MRYGILSKRNDRPFCYSLSSPRRMVNAPKRIGTESASVCTATTSVPSGGAAQDRSAGCRMRGRSLVMSLFFRSVVHRVFVGQFGASAPSWAIPSSAPARTSQYKIFRPESVRSVPSPYRAACTRGGARSGLFGAHRVALCRTLFPTGGHLGRFSVPDRFGGNSFHELPEVLSGEGQALQLKFQSVSLSYFCRNVEDYGTCT